MIPRSLFILALTAFAIHFPTSAHAQSLQVSHPSVELSNMMEVENSLYDEAVKELASPIPMVAPMVEEPAKTNFTSQIELNSIEMPQLHSYPISPETYSTEFEPELPAQKMVCTSGG